MCLQSIIFALLLLCLVLSMHAHRSAVIHSLDPSEQDSKLSTSASEPQARSTEHMTNAGGPHGAVREHKNEASSKVEETSDLIRFDQPSSPSKSQAKTTSTMKSAPQASHAQPDQNVALRTHNSNERHGIAAIMSWKPRPSQREYDEIWHDNQKLTEENQGLMQEIRSLYRNLNQLQEVCSTTVQERDREKMEMVKQLSETCQENQKLQNSLEKCKERIFNIQPVEEISDTQIAEEYASLCENIGDWAERQLGDYDNFLERVPSATWKEGLEDFVRDYFEEDGYVEVIGKYPAAAVLFARNVIAQHIHDFFLVECKHYPGLCIEHENLLTMLEESMRDFKPRRGKQSVRKVIG